MKLLILFLLLPLSIHAEEISVLTWNTFLLPPPINMTKQKQRAALMADKLISLDHDIMFFQEAFYNKKRRMIIRELKTNYPFIAVPKSGNKLKQLQDSGLFIASKFPMKILDQVIFKDCATTDCFASKSAIIVEVTLPNDKKIQMINTHLQAWNDSKMVAVRKKQLQEIKKLMATYAKKDIPQVLVGDLNIDGKIRDEYEQSLKLMEMTSTPLEGPLKSTNGFSTSDCFKNPGGSADGEWIDHMWLKSNQTDTVIRSKKVLPIIAEINSNECPLSDHYALEAVIDLN